MRILRYKLRVLARLKLFWFIYRDPRTPFGAKVALTVVGLAYLVWPWDLIPSFIPVIGWVDDLLVLTIVGWLITRLAPWWVRQEGRMQMGLEDEGSGEVREAK